MAASAEKIHTQVEKTTADAAARERSAAARLFVVVTFLLIFAMAARTPLDTDMWWHLRAGEETLRSGRPLLSDLFTFTRQGAHWINHSWLSQVGMILLYRWAGFLGLGGAVAVLATLCMALVYGQCEGPAPLKSAALLLGSVVASVVWSVRPQLTSLVLLALVGYLLHLYRRRGQDALWVLPLVFILWSNLHGGYVLGLLLIGAVLAGEGLNHLLGIEALAWPKIFRLALFALLCGLVVLANPNGLDTWRIPFQTVNVGVLQQFIPEWASPDFHQVLQQSLLWLLLGVVAAVGLSGRVMDGADLLVVLVFAFMALAARRNFGPFALVAVPVFTRYAALALHGWSARAAWLGRLTRARTNKTDSTPAARRIKTALNLLLVALLSLVAFGKLYVVTHPALTSYYIQQQYPTRAAGWLSEHQSGRRVLNEYDWGGYLQWALRDTPIFVDGRTDLFGDALLGDWITAIQAEDGWQVVLDRYAIELVMMKPDRPLAGALASAGWQKLYQDDQAVIYGR